jgi:Ala-tRNA(Pro) deacylase
MSKSPSSRDNNTHNKRQQDGLVLESDNTTNNKQKNKSRSRSPATTTTTTTPTAARTILAQITNKHLPMGGEEEWATHLTNQFTTLLTPEEANLATFLAAVGITQHPSQLQRRERILGDTSNGRTLLLELETKLKNRSFFTIQQGVEGPCQADAILAWTVRDIFDAVLEESDRLMDFPRVHRWLSSCLEHTIFEQAQAEYLEAQNCLDRSVPMRIFRGAVRQGNMLDVRADSRDARRAADVVKQINAGYKKKETQRQKEAKKTETPATNVTSTTTTSPAQPLTFQLPSSKIPISLSEDEKVSQTLAMLQGIPDMPQKEFPIVNHAPAQDAQVLVDLLNQQNLKGIPCKNLFLKAKKPRDDKDSCLWLVCCPTDATVDLKALQSTLGYKDQIRFSTPEVLNAALDVVQGHVTPFALVNDPQRAVNVILDSGMMSDSNSLLWFHPMINTRSLGISPPSLLAFIKASGRVPMLLPLTTGSKSTAATTTLSSTTIATAAAPPVPLPGMTSSTTPEPQPSWIASDAVHSPQAQSTWKASSPNNNNKTDTTPSTSKDATPLSFTLTHEAARERVFNALKNIGVEAPKPEKVDDNDAATMERPKGHGTHNLLVKDKKTKQLYLICLRQDRHIDLKTLGDKIGAKELRLAGPADVQSAIASTEGCVTPIWMVNNVQATITPVFDKALLDNASTPLVVCAGCKDAKNHKQHNVVSITTQQMIDLIKQVKGAQEIVVLEV